MGKIARMICGDAPYHNFPYRSSSYLTAFFEEIDLDYVHDGSTRYWWVRSVLNELNELRQQLPALPSPEITKVIEHLVNSDHFEKNQGKPQVSQKEAVEILNECIRKYNLRIDLDEKTTRVRLCPLSERYVSTALPEREARRTITFAPGVFSVPEKDADPNFVSVMMPFAAEYDGVYDTIKKACQQASLKCYRADDIWEESTFIQDIFNLIFQSSIVIVDFTGRNSNVMYETGISHTLGKSVIPLTQNLDDIPSDLKPHRALKYFPNSEGLQDLQKELLQRLQTLRTRHGS